MIKNKPICQLLLSLLLSSLFGGAFAYADLSPQEVVQKATSDVTSLIISNQASPDKNPNQLSLEIEKVLSPYFDFERMSRLVLGRNWKRASLQQQHRFVAEFRNLLIRTYGTALVNYEGGKIHHHPAKSQSKGRILVTTDVLLSKNQKLPIRYTLKQDKSKKWKIYDVSIDGISLIITYRNSYSPIANSSGIDTLISKIASSNSVSSR